MSHINLKLYLSQTALILPYKFYSSYSLPTLMLFYSYLFHDTFSGLSPQEFFFHITNHTLIRVTVCYFH